MASNRKYAALPDLDSAPDIYETPELTDDTSTIPPTTVRSPSDHEYDDDDDAAAISRSRLRIDQARSKFMPAAVDSTGVDFSDRVSGKRKSYKASSRRHRILDDGTEELGDLSDEDDAGNLARKIARLRREVEEAKAEYGNQKATTNENTAETAAQEEEIESLSKTLEEMAKLDEPLASRTVAAPTPRATSAGDRLTGDIEGAASYTITYAPDYEQTHALAKAADFDQRLVFLEKALGVGSAAMPEFDSNGLPRAIIPLVENLHKQISTLSEASTPSLDAISRRVRALTQEAENLEKARKNAKTAQDALASTGAATAGEGLTPEDSEQIAKVNALYGMIPTIENLSPLLPPLLDRLRSLRMIHADAATASETLSQLEQKQAEMATDIQQWREGLEKLEVVVRDAGASREKNMEMISEWVKDLEGKMSKLS
ncbi:Dynamitin-domain-containing protein [Triangularia verruculosa]|uniref:Dynamitin-domain-containing protein n=1 Tax=Triangularia verruculosa TaxID=2587418 RepID=A0AAN6XMR1_9PEZI|nr:Dynamitin-domain-containing protein [Triangularia verruculosa]